jgi:hypothetical protein
MTTSNKDYLYEEMLSLIERMNYAFYVKGTSKALNPVMAETKQILAKARGYVNLGLQNKAPYVPFTNDDLRHTKLGLSAEPLWHVEGKRLGGLIARLEAAEKVCTALRSYKFPPETKEIQDALEEWEREVA